MKQIIAAIFAIVTVITLVAVSFTLNQVAGEEERLKRDLHNRSTLLAESLKETVEPNFINKSDEYLQKLVLRFDNRERFAGVAIYDNKGNTIAASSSLPKEESLPVIAANAMDADKPNGDFIQFKDRKIYFLAIPLRDEKSVVGSLMVAQNASYIDDRLTEIWKNSLLRLSIQLALLSLAAVLVSRWIIYKPIKSIAESLKSARSGEPSKYGDGGGGSFFFKPLIKEVSKIRRSLLEARFAAAEEARLRGEKLDSPWTAHRLKTLINDVLKGRTIFMVSNREPYVHIKDGGKISYYFPASGMVTALEPVMQACGGMWVAQGSGDADRLVVDEEDKVKVPPDEPKYTLRRVWLTKEEEKGYYYGFSNEGLWPLCHIVHERPIFKKEDWEEYKKVNGKFANAVLTEIKNQEKPVVLIQDFQLALLPRMIKNSRPDATIAIFWHIPFPNPESFSICPWKKDILDGILGADLIGFHTQLHCNNFIETVGRELEALIDFEHFTVTRNGHTSFIKPFPISIAFPDTFVHAGNEKFDRQKLLKELNIKTKYVGVGVDRLDYTKGILERLKALEIFFKKNPSYQENFTFFQVAAPSRSEVKRYREFEKEVEEEVERINSIYKKNNWKPIILQKRHHTRAELYEIYRMADLCLVTSLHDGMNLVSKEFVAARDDCLGSLVLSQYAGASKELKEALITNPYNGEQTAEAIKTALEMPASEQRRRMVKMRETIKGNNVYRWSADFLKTISTLE